MSVIGNCQLIIRIEILNIAIGLSFIGITEVGEATYVDVGFLGQLEIFQGSLTLGWNN